MNVYLATSLREEISDHDEDEFLSLVKIDLREVFAKIQSGEIEDGKTISAFMLVMPLLNELLIAAN